MIVTGWRASEGLNRLLNIG